MSDKLIPFDEYLEQKRREAEAKRERARLEAEARGPVEYKIPPTVTGPSGLACKKCGLELTEEIPGTSGSLMLWEAYFRCDHCGQHHGRGPRTGKNGNAASATQWGTWLVTNE